MKKAPFAQMPTSPPRSPSLRGAQRRGNPEAGREAQPGAAPLSVPRRGDPSSSAKASSAFPGVSDNARHGGVSLVGAPSRPGRGAVVDDFLTDDMRVLQEKFQTRRLANKVRERAFRTTFTSADRAFIDNADVLLPGHRRQDRPPAMSYKAASAASSVSPAHRRSRSPVFEGNGLYLSGDKIAATGRVDLLFIDFGRHPGSGSTERRSSTSTIRSSGA